MILIPEQVHILREKIKNFESQKRKNDESMVDCERNIVAGDVEQKYIDKTFETTDGNMVEEILKQYKEALKNGEIITNIPTDKIGYGTKFSIEFSKDDTEEYIFTENSIGIRSTAFRQQNSYISKNSPFGEAVFGKTVGDEVSYDFETNNGTVTINGRIIKIIERTSDDVHLITSRPMSERLAKRKIVAEPVEVKENEITISQYELLKEERGRLEKILARFNCYENIITIGSIITLKDKKGNEKKFTIVDKEQVDFKSEIDSSRLVAKRIYSKKIGDIIKESSFYNENGKRKEAKYSGTLINIDNSHIEKEESVYENIYQVKSKLRKVNSLLETVKIVNPNDNNKVGIGSRVSIMILEKNGKNKFLRVEVINRALTTEDNYSYIEATSSLGASIIGLSNNDKFEFYGDNMEIKEGMVYDIDNAMTLTKDLSYQKRS